MAQYVKGMGGNIRIRPAGTPIEWDQHKLNEFKKCAENPEYFIRNYVYIKNVDEEELILFQPRSYQLEMLDKMLHNRNVIIKLPRQCGKTSLTAAVLLWHLIFMRNFSILVAAHKGDKARDVIGNIKEMFEELPDFLQHGVDTWNKGSIKLETGSRVRASATSAGSARGDVYNMVYLDEFAFVAKHVAEEFVKSVIPTVSSGKTTKIFITSTPRGLNLFHSMWQAAVSGRSNYKTVEIKWNEVPGRDEAFRKDIISQFGQEYFDQEYGAEFLGSSKTLVSGWKLLEMLGNITPPEKVSDHVVTHEFPKEGHQYAITVDVSEGLGGDYHVAMVFDITSLPFKMAGYYRDNELDPLALPGVIHDMARAYNDALVLIEANFGQQIGDILYTHLEYENIVFTAKGKTGTQAKVDRISSGYAGKTRAGISWNHSSKRIACTNLKTLIEQDQLIITDRGIYDELTRFTVKGKSYAADDGNDDLVMCLVMFAWMVDQGYVRDTTDTTIRGKIAELRAERIENDMMPMGFSVRGDEEEFEPINFAPPPIDIPGEEKHQFSGLFDRVNSRGGLSELELHDMFMRDIMNGVITEQQSN